MLRTLFFQADGKIEKLSEFTELQEQELINMKIVMIAGAGGSGGLKEYLKGFLSHFEKTAPKSFKLSVICTPELASELCDTEMPGVKIIVSEKSATKIKDCLFNRPHAPEVISLVEKEKPDVVYFPNSFLRPGLEGYKSVLEVHNQLYFQPRQLLRQGFGKATFSLLVQRRTALKSIKKADLVVFDSETSRRECISSGIKPKVSTVAYFGVRHLPFSDKKPGTKLQEKKEYIYISAFYPYKNHAKLLRGLALLKANGRDFTLRLVGSGPKHFVDAVRKEADLLGISANVVFENQVPHEKIPELIDKADVFIYASEIETSGLGLMEGMERGAVIACNRSSCLPEILGDGGLLFSADDPKDIADVVKRLSDDITLREKLSRKAREISLKYTWERHNEIIFGKLNELFK